MLNKEQYFLKACRSLSCSLVLVCIRWVSTYEATEEYSMKRRKEAKGRRQNLTSQIICATVWNPPACKHSEVSLHRLTCEFWPSVHRARRPHCLSTFWWATRTHYLHLAFRDLATARTITTSLYENPLLSHSSYCLWNMRQRTQGFPDLPPFLVVPSCALSKTSSSKKLFGFHCCRNVFRETFISELPATGDRIGGHFTGLVRENRKRELHCNRMTFTCIFTFTHSCCRMEATPCDWVGRRERSQPAARATSLLA